MQGKISKKILMNRNRSRIGMIGKARCLMNKFNPIQPLSHTFRY